MSRPATGSLEVKRLSDGTYAYKLRFGDAAHGAQRITVHSRLAVGADFPVIAPWGDLTATPDAVATPSRRAVCVHGGM